MSRAPSRPAAGAGGNLPLRLVVGAVVGAGALSIGSSFLHLDALRDPPSLFVLAVAAVAFFVGDVPMLNLRFGREQYSFTWSELAVVIGLVALPSPWLRLVATACVAASHLAHRRPLVKVAFNAAGFATGMVLARAAYSAIAAEETASHPVDPVAWLALAAGAGAFFAWNTITVAAAVAASQRVRFREVVGAGMWLKLLVFAGNTSAGIVLVVIADTRPALLVVIPCVVAILGTAYRGYLRALEDRDTWEVLHTASQELLGAGRPETAAIAVRHAAPLFDAGFVELMLVDTNPAGEGSPARVWRLRRGGAVEVVEGDAGDLGSTFWARVACEREVFQARAGEASAVHEAELATLGLGAFVIAPLTAGGACFGTLRLGFERNVRLRERQLQVLGTFANQISAAVISATLFEETADERETLRRVVENTSDGIFAVDDAGLVFSWNTAMERMTGRRAVEAVGRPVHDALGARTEDGEPVTAPWMSALLYDTGQFEAPVVVEAGGVERWLSLSVSAVGTVDDGIGLAVAVARDVTAARDAETAKQDFVATVSHELRTPLTPIKGFLLTLLRPAVELDEHTRQDVYRRMLDQTQRLERLIEDLLTISQMDRGTFRVDRTEVDLDDVLARAAREAPRTVEVVPSGGAMVLADAGRVEQVLDNLLGNAHKYSPIEGRIMVGAEVREGAVVVSVQDEGDGIPVGEEEAVFERFRRLGNHMTRASGGTGLGLYITRCLVETMGGQVWVERSPASGACFRFTLPLVAVDRRGTADVTDRALAPA